MTPTTPLEQLKFWTEELTDPSFVYVCQGREGTPIKIGTARDPLARLRGLQTGNPQHLRLIHVLPGDEFLERDLHSRLNSFRQGGEWFWICEETELVLEIVAGLARYLIDNYDGSGRAPAIPSFDRLRSPQQIADDEAVIREFWVNLAPVAQIADEVGMTAEELDAELARMRSAGRLPDRPAFHRVRDHGIAKTGFRKLGRPGTPYYT